MKYLIFTLCLVSSVSISAKLPIDADMSIYGLYADSMTIQSLKGGVRLGLASSGVIDDNLRYQGKINVFFEQGSHITLNDDSYSNANTYGVDYGTIIYSPLTFLDLSLGVQDVQKEASPLFIHPPSLGTKEVVKLVDNNNWFLFWENQQNIVKTDYVQNRLGKLNQRASYYITSELKYKLSNANYNMAINAGYFKFFELNSKNAYDSSFRGSQIIGSLATNSKFLYQYEGINADFKIDLNNIYYGIELYAQYLLNQDSSDIAQLYGANIGLSEKLILTLEYFRNERNTLPAIVVNPYYGGTNREGQKFGLFSTINKKSHMEINFYMTDTIVASAYQKPLNILFLAYGLDI
jgi:hypothetical protein